MAIPLFNYVKSLLGHLRKDDILEDLRVTKGEFENLRQTYQLFTDKEAGYTWKAKATSDLTKVFYRNFKAPGTKLTNTFVLDVSGTIPTIVQNLELIDKELEQVLGADVLNEGLTAKKAILIRACEHLSFLSRYSLDVLNYVICAESAPKDYPLDRMMSKASVEWVESHILPYAQLMSIYARAADKFKAQMTEIPEVVLNDANASTVAAVFTNEKLDPFGSMLVQGFTGSPIYHIRLIFAEWQANRYKASKEKKQVLELRLMQLKLMMEDMQDPGLEKQIQYLQDRIDKLDRKLADMEQ